MTDTSQALQWCDRARRLAEDGDTPAAAALFRRVLDLGATPYRARAALGLAVVLDDDGDVVGAREADRAAMATGDPEYGSRAAYHLALTHERASERAEAASAWAAVVGFDHPDHLPPAHLALARIADDDGDFGRAREHWERAVATGDPQYGPLAAHDLAQRLLERGEPVRAQRVLTAGLKLVGADAAPQAYARLAVALGIACLDQAISAFTAALGDPAADRGADPDAGPLATELLARALPLRGRAAEATQVWRRGRADPGIAGQVRARLRRDFGDDAGEPAEASGAAELWWEPVLERAVEEGTLPAVAGEAFGALDHMYALLAVVPPGGDAGPAADDAVAVPDAYGWGPLLRESFEERLRLAEARPRVGHRDQGEGPAEELAGGRADS